MTDFSRSTRSILTLLVTMTATAIVLRASATFPDPAKDIHVAAGSGQHIAVLAGGCFWGVEAVFERLNGVSDVVSGFAGGASSTAHYDLVSDGGTGHAESVKITYDPSRITYGQLLKVFFAVAHDPTQLNRQGPDVGTQYRSSIFYGTDDEKLVAEAYIRQLNEAKVFSHPIVTSVAPLRGFYPAEDYHQDFVTRNPRYPYVVFNDLPKLQHLKEQFPGLLKPGR